MSIFLKVAMLAYFMAPAYAANMAPIVSRKFKYNPAIDFNLEFRGDRLLGNNKTVLGVVFGMLAALVTGFVQHTIFLRTGFSVFDDARWLSISLLLGTGALLGDSVKSFFKRRVKIKSGHPWIPFDEIDFSICALAMVSFVYFPGWFESIIIIIVSALGHITINHAAFYLNIRKEKW